MRVLIGVLHDARLRVRAARPILIAPSAARMLDGGLRVRRSGFRLLLSRQRQHLLLIGAAERLVPQAVGCPLGDWHSRLPASRRSRPPALSAARLPGTDPAPTRTPGETPPRACAG